VSQADATQEKKKMGRPQKKFLEILEKNLGIVAPACRANKNMARSTHYDWMKKYEGYAEKVEEINEMTLDFVEGKLMQNVSDGDPASIFFFLKCKGKRRGYVEKQEVEHSGNIGTTINIIPASKVKKDG
jgi:hypothetical protein